MSINLSVNFSHPEAIATQVSYARIDNTSNPVFTTVVPNLAGGSGTFTIAQNIPDGQYQINALPIYADKRVCQPTVSITSACPGLISITASISGSVLVIKYLAPSSAPKVRISINYPNGGSFAANYVNDGNPISVGIPSGVFGVYSISGQSVCDESSSFYSAPSGSVTVNYAPSISGTYQLGNSVLGACGAGASTLYTGGSAVPGSILFTDPGLTSAITGYTFVVYAGVIYNLDSATGTLGSNTGATCSATMTARNSLSFINITGISGIPGFIYNPTSGSFSQGSNHGAFTGMITVNWNGVVPSGTPFSIHLYRNGVIIDCYNYPAGSTSTSWTSGSFTFLATDVILIDSGTGAC